MSNLERIAIFLFGLVLGLYLQCTFERLAESKHVPPPCHWDFEAEQKPFLPSSKINHSNPRLNEIKE